MKMRKFLFLAACTLLMASCSSDSFLGEEAVPVTPEKKTPILFSSVTGKVQKAPATGTSAATLLGNKFVVYGANTTDGTAYSSVFDNYQVTYAPGTDSTTESNTSGWEYVGNTSLNGATQGIKYWDQSQQKYQFVAVSGLTGAEKITNQNGFTVTVDADKAGNVYVSDRVTVLPANYNNTVQLSFRRLTSRIRVGFYETIPGYAVKDVKFYYTTAAAGSTTVGLGSKYPSNGTYTVTYGANDVANVAYAAAGTTQRYMQFGTLNYTSAASTAGDPAKPYLDADGVPTATATNAFLGTTSTTATFGKGSYTIDGVPGTASDYRPVLPLEDNNTPMYLNADFTLVATDGSGSTIKVNQAHATVPAALTQCKPNYSYTYLFKITDRVNGSTNPPVTPPTEPVDPDTPIDPTNPVDPSVPTNPQDSALYAITFDAVAGADSYTAYVSLGGVEKYSQAVAEAVKDENAEVLLIGAGIEADIAELETYEEKQMFLEDLGLKESGVNRLIKAAYRLLGLQTFLTAGPKECRAWTFKKGMKAPQTAGIIHSDFERGFIRAEVIKYDDYVALGSEAKCREAGKIAVEGKDYVVQDGDIMHFRFNV